MTKKYCCEDFEALVDWTIIEEDHGVLRSNGAFTREKYLMKCISDWGNATNDVYIKFCPRCGKVLNP